MMSPMCWVNGRGAGWSVLGLALCEMCWRRLPGVEGMSYRRSRLLYEDYGL